MENISSWIQTVITVGALGIVWASIRTSRSDLKKEVDKDMAELVKDLDEAKGAHIDFMTIPKHTDLCRIQSLETQKFFTKELAKLKDDIFGGLRSLENMIKNGKSKPGDKDA